jgi:O-antigen/teichoic acid export membrane protein
MPTDKKNSIWLSIQYIITIIFALLMLKFNIQHFGKELFGIWIILASIWGVGATVDFGFGLAIVKYIAQYKDDKEKVDKILSSVFFVFLFLGSVIFILGVLIAYMFYFNNIKLISTRFRDISESVFFILGLAFLFQYLSIFFRSVLEGLNRFITTSKIIIIQNTIMLIGVIIIYYFGFNILCLSYLYFFTYLVIFLSYFLFYKYRICRFRISYSNFEFKSAKEIFKFSVSIQIMNFSNSLIDPVVKYMLGNYFSVDSIPAYEIAKKFATAISGLYFNAFKFILPKASALKSADDILSFIKKEMTNYAKLGVFYSGMTFGVALLPLITIMSLFFGMKEAIIIFLILALPESINNFGYSIYNFLLGVGKAKLLALVQVNNLLFVILGLFIGFNSFHNIFGLLGYFVSVVLGNILMVVYMNKKWNVSLFNLAMNSRIYKLIILSFLIFISAILFYNFKLNQYLIWSFVSIVSASIFYKDGVELVGMIYKPLKNNFKIYQ